MEELPQENDLAEKFDCYGGMLFRMCMVTLCNRQDAEDAVQDTFESYLRKKPVFQNGEHEKAWFLRVAANRCKDKRRAAFFRRSVPLEELVEYAQTTDETDLLDQLAALPPRCRSVLFLHYVEGYRIAEIAGLLGIREGAVKTALFRGREKLKLELGEECAI